MSLRKILASITTLAALALLSPHLHAQHEIHRGLPYVDTDGLDPDLWQPFVDTGAFPHDFQFFAPAEFGEFGDGPDAPTGWFGTYDRLSIFMTRPEAEVSSTRGDYTWGNRFAIGYMSEEDHGWFGEVWHIDGPNAFNITEAERVNVINLNDEVNSTPGSIDLRGGGPINAAGAQNEGVPRSDQNNPITDDRRYFIKDSLNAADLNSFEINKSFRWKKLHYGSTMEPFFGFRYIRFEDHTQQDSYSRITDLGVDVGQFPPLTQDPSLLQNERFDSVQSTFDNHMVGGQFGARWFKEKGRWNLSGEVRAFLFSNFQYLETVNRSELTFYDAAAVDEPVEAVFLNDTYSYGNSTEFAFGGEVRAQAAYEVTRDLALRFGMTFMELGRGVGRGSNINFNQEDLTLFGMTFGIDFKR